MGGDILGPIFGSSRKSTNDLRRAVVIILRKFANMRISSTTLKLIKLEEGTEFPKRVQEICEIRLKHSAKMSGNGGKSSIQDHRRRSQGF